MTKNKYLFKNLSIFLCLVPMLLLSLFCLVPKKQNLKVSAADIVVTNFNFVSSNIIVAVTMQNFSNNNFDRQTLANLTLSFGVEDGIYRAAINGYCDVDNHTNVNTLSGVLTNVPNAEKILSNTVFLNVYNSSTNYGYHVRVFHSGQLTSNIIKVQYSHYENLTPNTIKPANYYNTITYYDDQGEFIQFEFPLFTNGQSFANRFLFVNRIYYFTSSFDDNDYYNEGYKAGIDEGFNKGEDIGYQNGYNAGETIGYGKGYNAGVEHGSDYSFMGLIGAVIDAPVSAFTSLLNFELLGVNILGFISGLLTLALIIFIIKLCMGGK